LELLAALGDVATMALVAVLWRFDRRILSIETFLKHKLKFGG
jgi:hypothetical protein